MSELHLDTQVSGIQSRLIDYDKPEDYLEFTYLPEELNEEINATWEEVQIIGRSAPIMSYGSTGPRVTTIELWFVADGTKATVKEEVHNKVMFLRSFVYPEYRAHNIKPPHRLQVILGGFLNTVGVVENMPVTWRAPYEVETLFPMVATVSLVVRETVPNPFDYQTIRNYQGGYSPVETYHG